MPVSVSLTCLHCAHTCLHCAHTWTVTGTWLRSAYLTWLHCAHTWTVTAAWLRRSESGVQWWCAELWETEYNDTAINYSWLWKYIMTLKRKLKTVNKFVSKTRTRHTGAAVKTTNNAHPLFKGIWYRYTLPYISFSVHGPIRFVSISVHPISVYFS